MKTALRLRICFFIFLLFPLVTSAARLEIKGVPLGASEAEVKQKFPWAECDDNQPQNPSGDRRCLARRYDSILDKGKEEWESTFGGAYVSYFAFDFYAGKLHRVTIGLHSNWFDDVTKTLITKYGKPKNVSEGKLQNRLGAVFTNQIYTWRFGDDTILAQRYFGDLDSSVIMYETNYAAQEFERRKHLQVQDKVKDL